jgi:hypothetical protein
MDVRDSPLRGAAAEGAIPELERLELEVRWKGWNTARRSCAKAEPE